MLLLPEPVSSKQGFHREHANAKDPIRALVSTCWDSRSYGCAQQQRSPKIPNSTRASHRFPASWSTSAVGGSTFADGLVALAGK